MAFNKLLVLIPTRNRAELAINAVNSVLTQTDCNVEVIVSDNSTEEVELISLKQFCEELQDERLHYIKPPSPLPMSKHFNWALEQTLQLSSASHITILPDRWVFKPHALREIVEIVNQYPEKILSYSWDSVDDERVPVKLLQAAWTGKLFEVKSSYLLDLATQMSFTLPILPAVLHVCVPREVYHQVRQKYGTYFTSISPDYNFAYSSLTLVSSVIYYDKPLIVHYATARSQGISGMRGVPSRDALDFLKHYTPGRLSFDTPLPVIHLMTNAMLHEYCYVRQKSEASNLPDFDREKYLSALTADVILFRDAKRKREMLLKLYKNYGMKFLKSYARAQIDQARSKFPIRTRLRQALQKIALIKEPMNLQLEKRFDTTAEALDYNIRHPQKQNPSFENIEGWLGFNPLIEESNKVSVIDYEPHG